MDVVIATTCVVNHQAILWCGKAMNTAITKPKNH